MAGTLSLLVFLVVPGLAAAQDGYDTEPTREEWVRQADAVCKETGKKSRQLARAAFDAGSKGKVVRSSRLLIRFGRRVLGVVDQIREITRPPADAGRIERSLDFAAKSDRIVIRSGRAFVDRKVRRGNNLFRRAVKVGERSTKLMKGFGLKHCV